MENQSAISAAREARRTNSKSQVNTSSNGGIQIGIGILLLIAVIVIGYVLQANVSPKVSLMWIFGILFGVALQRSRFCFTAAVRDPLLTGSSSLAKSVIIAIAVASAGFAAIHYTLLAKGATIATSGAFFFVKPVGLHTAVGAFLFGVGMVIASGCASGTLMRIGEGFTMQIVALAFFITGVMLGIYNRPFWKGISISKSPTVYLPETFGWFPALCLHFGLLLACFLLVDVIAKKYRK